MTCVEHLDKFSEGILIFFPFQFPYLPALLPKIQIDLKTKKFTIFVFLFEKINFIFLHFYPEFFLTNYACQKVFLKEKIVKYIWWTRKIQFRDKKNSILMTNKHKIQLLSCLYNSSLSY